MTIAVSDIKILESQRLTDDEDGGGRATGNEVVSGDVNNLFNDISRLDRTVGDVSARKIFTGVMTDNNDVYLGAHLVCVEAPNDPNVSLVMFNTDSQTDERADARSRIESYVVKAAQATLYPLGHQLEGQRSLLCVQRLTDPLPEIGDIYALIEGSKEQFIKVQRIEYSIQKFVHEPTPGTYVDVDMRQLIIDLTSALKNDFTGGRVTPSGVVAIPGYGTPAQILSTQVADAARYYGISHLAAAANPGDANITVGSIFSPIVPSARQESPLVDQDAIPARDYYAPTGAARSVAQTYSRTTGNTSRSYATTAVLPGSASLSISGGSYVDTGAGKLAHSSGSKTFNDISIDYLTGAIDVTAISSYFEGGATFTYTPAIPLPGRVVSNRIEISLANRQRNYTLNLAAAKPKRGTLLVDYMVLGKWYRMQDSGAGTLTGHGAGTINYDSGSVIITLDALPDTGTALIYNYLASDSVVVNQRTAEVTLPDQKITGTISLSPGSQVVPGSVTLSWLVGGLTKTVTDDGAGNLSGDATGTIRYSNGFYSVVMSTLPDNGTTMSHDWEQADTITLSEPLTLDVSHSATVNIPGAPLQPGSISVKWRIQRKHSNPYAFSSESVYSEWVEIRDDTLGGFTGTHAAGATINYSTGEVTFTALNDYTFSRREYSDNPGFNSGTITTVSSTETEALDLPDVTINALAAATTGTGSSETATFSGLSIDLLPAVTEPILEGSIVMSWGGDTYIDRAGVLYKAVSTVTNVGLVAGSVDYENRTVTIDSPAWGATNTVNLSACATAAPEGLTVKYLYFRTPGAPIAVGSLQLVAQRADTGETLTASADFNGVITGGFTGQIDIATGIIRISSSNGLIPDSIQYNCIVLTTIPLDAELIGLDPVRLPSDGRVPVFRQGDVVVLSHTQTTDIGTPVADQVINLGRDHLAEIEIMDSAGLALDPSQYTEDRDAGTLTMSGSLVLQAADTTALTPPLVVKDRIDHMSMLADVQIGGVLSLLTPVAHTWPLDETVVSSALLYGDTQSRFRDLFTQKTWTNQWQDSRIGDDSTAKYNDVTWPPVVTNRSAISERWALVFTSSSTFNIVGETLGIIGSGQTAVQTAPINPATGTPFFILAADGWGTGWAINNVLRFNTESALNPAWLIRVVKPGSGTVDLDGFVLQARGDAD